MTTVYIAECGVYAERYIQGVYSTLDAAIAANPIDDRAKAKYPAAKWHEHGDGVWDNGCDYLSAAEITAFEVQEQDHGA